MVNQPFFCYRFIATKITKYFKKIKYKQFFFAYNILVNIIKNVRKQIYTCNKPPENLPTFDVWFYNKILKSLLHFKNTYAMKKSWEHKLRATPRKHCNISHLLCYKFKRCVQNLENHQKKNLVVWKWLGDVQILPASRRHSQYARPHRQWCCKTSLPLL